MKFTCAHSLKRCICVVQDVAIKILRNVQDDSQQYQEFLQVGVMSVGNHVLATPGIRGPECVASLELR